MSLLMERWMKFIKEDGHSADKKELDKADVDIKLPLNKKIVLQADSEKYNKARAAAFKVIENNTVSVG